MILLSGCVSYSEVQKKRVDAIPLASRAYLVGAFVVSCTPREGACNQTFNSISLYYQSLTDPDFGGMLDSMPFNMFGGATIYDIVDTSQKETGIYFCDTVPAGRIALVSYRFYNFAGGGSGYSLSKDKQFSVPFDVAAGEILDLGRLKVTTGVGENIFGMDLNVPGHLLLSDLNSEQQRLALAKCPPDAQSAPVRQAHLRAVMANGHPLVQDEAR